MRANAGWKKAWIVPRRNISRYPGGMMMNPATYQATNKVGYYLVNSFQGGLYFSSMYDSSFIEDITTESYPAGIESGLFGDNSYF